VVIGPIREDFANVGEDEEDEDTDEDTDEDDDEEDDVIQASNV